MFERGTALKETVHWLMAIASIGLACGQAPIKGTYEIELQVAGASRPLTGTLILSTLPLELPSFAGEEVPTDAEWFGGEGHSANSCFILKPTQASIPAGAAEPDVVRVFESQILSDGVRTPIEILHATDLKIEIAQLRFFGNALGGELEVHLEQGVRPGRIVGTRTGDPKPQLCVEKLVEFRAYLQRRAAEGADA
jgi:hypothetical protein